MKHSAIKLSALICFAVLLFSVTAYGASSSAAADSVGTQSKPSQTAATEFRISIDVTDLYTGGVNYDGNNSTDISGKAVFIGILCIFLVAGIVLICVKSRVKDDDIGDADDRQEADGSSGKGNGSADGFDSDDQADDDDSDN